MKMPWLIVIVSIFAIGCQNEPAKQVKLSKTIPQFSLAFSEYPSWVTFAVASEKGIIDGRPGMLGPIEEKWNVDIVLKEADYDTCITMYANGNVDASCITNIDVLSLVAGRPAVAILPTSTSSGGDACIVVDGRTNVHSLKDMVTYGLEKSVSQYAFERNLVLAGLNPKDYKFKNIDPAAASQAVQTNQSNVESIMVWEPFALQTLRTRKGSKVLFSSQAIPEEIIDCVMMGADSLKKEGGERFANAVVETYYAVNVMLSGTDRAETLIALGAKFSSLGLDDMTLICIGKDDVPPHVSFFSTPEKGLKLFNSEKFRNETMPIVVKFCEGHDIVSKSDTKRFGFDSDAPLVFSTKFMNAFKNSSNSIEY